MKKYFFNNEEVNIIEYDSIRNKKIILNNIKNNKFNINNFILKPKEIAVSDFTSNPNIVKLTPDFLFNELDDRIEILEMINENTVNKDSNDLVLNKFGSPLYTMHFTSMTSEDSYNREVIDYIVDNAKIEIDSDISVISEMNKRCLDYSIVERQFKKNNLAYINSALDEDIWCNTNKIRYILDSLKQVKTKYTLIIDGRDVLLTKSFDKEFINKFKSYNKPIVYNATLWRYPSIEEVGEIKGEDEITNEKYSSNNLNAGVCFGETETLIKFYEYAEEINKRIKNNHSEQFIIRHTRVAHPELVEIDYKCILFYSNNPVQQIKTCNFKDKKIFIVKNTENNKLL